MIYIILVYTASLLIFGKKNYLGNSKIPTYVKILHIIITFILFQFYFGDLRIFIVDFYNVGVDTFFTTTEFDKYSRSFDLISSLIYFITCIIATSISLDLAMKAKGRKLLMYFSPLIVLSTSIETYKYIIREFDFDDTKGLFFISFIFMLILFGCLNLYYNVNPGKRIFQEALEDSVDKSNL